MAKIYRVHLVELMELDGREYPPDEDHCDMVKREDYQILADAVPKHQRMFMSVCLERDRLQRKVWDLLKKQKSETS